MDHRAVADRNAGADHHERLDRDVLAEHGIGGEIDGFGRDQRHPGFHRHFPQPRLHHAFGLGELRLGVDAAHFVLAGFDHHGIPSLLADNADRIGQIIFALGIRIADLVEDRERAAPVDRHHPGIAQVDLALLGARIGLLAYRDQAVALDDEAAIAGGIGGAKAERRNRGAFGERRAQPRKGLGRDQRRVAERNQQIIHAPRNGIARRQHRMRGAEPFALHEGERVGADALCFVRHRLMVGSDHDRERGAGSLGRRGEHVGEQALVCDGMQHFRQV